MSEDKNKAGVNRNETKGRGGALGKYAVDFVVVLLAVFLGFWADSYRETLGDRAKEREYVVSLLRDLKSDSAVLTRVIQTNKEHLVNVNAFNETYKLNFNDQQNVNTFYITLIQSLIWSAYVFVPNEVTISQLKSTGDIGLLKEPHVADSLTQYILATESMRRVSARYWEHADRAMRLGYEVCDYFNYGKLYFENKAHPPAAPLLTTDKDKLRLFYNLTNDVYYTTAGYIEESEKLLRSINRLIAFLEIRYKLKK